MPTIYHWEMPVTVSQTRYNQLIKREGYYATPTPNSSQGKPTPDVGDVDFVDIRDYKDADEKGVKDSTSGLQRAMTDAVAAGARLLLRPGTYNTKSLNIPNGLRLEGYHPSGYGATQAKETRLSLISGTNDHMLLGTTGIAHVRISGIHFDGNKNNNTSGDIIHLNDAGVAEEAQWHIRDCFMDAAAGYGIYVGAGRRAVQISDCTVNYSRLEGIHIAGSDAHVDRCILGSNLAHGIGVGGTVCNVNDCDIYGNGTTGDTNTGDGITIFSTLTQVNLRGNRIDQNKRHGILIGNNCESITVTGNMLHGNSQHGNGNHNDVHVLSTKGSVTIANNTFSVDGNVSNKAGYAVNFAAGATAQGQGNVIQTNATVNGMTNLTRSFLQTRQVSKCDAWAPAAAMCQNMDRADSLIGTQTAVLVSGRLNIIGGFVVPGGVKVNRATFFSAGTNTAALTNCWAVLIN